MALYFITGNKNKFAEASHIIGNLKHIKLDLPEIQDINPKTIILAKLKEAFKQGSGSFIVDDTSLCFEAMGGLPGPFIKWFLQTLGTEGLWDLAKRLPSQKAYARCVIGYAHQTNVKFFEGIVNGKIVAPRGNYFGWDPIFQPEGYRKTYAELSRQEKNSISHRKLALEKLKQFLKG